MNIIADNAFIDGNHLGTAQIHILADFGNHVGQTFFKGFAAFRAVKFFHFADIAVFHQSNGCGVFNIFLKNFVFGNEVGFGVDFDNGAFITVNGNGNQTFGSNAAGFFSGAGQTFFTQPVNGSFHVSVCFGQSFFAVQHAGACCFS